MPDPNPPGQGARCLLDASATCLLPDDPAINAALLDIPAALAGMRGEPGYARKAVNAFRLIERLQGMDHSYDAALLAINEAIKQDRLQSELPHTSVLGRSYRPVYARPVRPNKLVVIFVPAPTSTEPPGTAAAAPPKEPPASEQLLTERQKEVLEALRLLGATSPENRRSAAVIAERAGGEATTAETVKPHLRVLKGLGLVESVSGRGPAGGYYLTQMGIERANKRG
jgi:hypothetical protein